MMCKLDFWWSYHWYFIPISSHTWLQRREIKIYWHSLQEFPLLCRYINFLRFSLKLVVPYGKGTNTYIFYTLPFHRYWRTSANARLFSFRKKSWLLVSFCRVWINFTHRYTYTIHLDIILAKVSVSIEGKPWWTHNSGAVQGTCVNNMHLMTGISKMIWIGKIFIYFN